jgi:hypothetical protein
MSKMNALQSNGISGGPQPTSPSNVNGGAVSAPGLRNGGFQLNPFEKEETDRQKLQLAQKTEADKNKLGQEGLDIKSQTSQQPKYIQMKTAGGDAYYIDSKTGRIVDTGVAQGTETGTEKAADVMNQIGARGQNAVNLENTKQPNRETNIKLRNQGAQDVANTKGANAIKLKQTPGAYNPTMLPSQDKVRFNNAYQKLQIDHPELAAMTARDPNSGIVSINETTPGGVFTGPTGPTDAQRALIKKYLGEPNAQPAQNPSYVDKNNPSQQSSAQPTPGQRPDGKVLVRVNGQLGYMDPTAAQHPGVEIVNPGTQSTKPSTAPQTFTNYPQLTNLIGPGGDE